MQSHFLAIGVCYIYLRKIPFLLFPKVDAFVAFFFSLLAFPPNKRENPKLVATLKWLLIAGVLVFVYFAYSFWSHQTPPMTKSQYENGLFELKSIVVKNDFHKEMLFQVDLKARVPEGQACLLAQPMAADILHDYPFDDQYKKEIEVVFNPKPSEANFHAYTLGVISLNNKHREKDGSFACYLKYKDE